LKEDGFIIELSCNDLEKLERTLYGDEIKSSSFGKTIYFYLKVDNKVVVFFQVFLQKHSGNSERIAFAEIQYQNLKLSTLEEEKYVGKGYVQEGLRRLTSFLLQYDIAFLYLGIHPSNLFSKKVVESCNYIKKVNSYYFFHPNHFNIYRNSLGNDFTEEQKDFIMKQYIFNYGDVFEESLFVNNEKQKRNA